MRAKVVSYAITAALIMIIGVMPATASASHSPAWHNFSFANNEGFFPQEVHTLFFYVTNRAGQLILVNAIPVEELAPIVRGYRASDGHGRSASVPGNMVGQPFSFSISDNLPASHYAQGYGFTIPELIDFVRERTSVPFFREDGGILFEGFDIVNFGVTDAGAPRPGGRFNDLYGTPRYYFPDFFNAEFGWYIGFETGTGGMGSEIDQQAMAYFRQGGRPPAFFTEDKNRVFENRVPTPPILAVHTVSDRMRTGGNPATGARGPIWSRGDELPGGGGALDPLTQIKRTFFEARGNFTGFFRETGRAHNDKGLLNNFRGLRFSLPLSEGEMRAGQRTAQQNSFFVDRVIIANRANQMINPNAACLARRPDFSLGAVAAPTVDAAVTRDGMLRLTISSATEGALIFHSYPQFDGVGVSLSAQHRYRGPVYINLAGRDPNTLSLGVRAVKEGYSDAGEVIIRLRNVPQVPDTNLTALNAAIASAQALNQGNYTPATWAQLQIALMNAITVRDNSFATQEQVDNAANALATAINALVPQAGRSALNSAITIAQNKVPENYTPISWSAMQTALAAAIIQRDYENATQTAIDNAETALNTAINSLIPRANRTVLSAAIKDAQDRASDRYTPESLAVLQSVLAETISVYVDNNSTQAQVNTAEGALTSAISALVLRADRTGLNNAIADANGRVGANYTPSSWALLQSYLSAAISVRDNPNAAQNAVDSAREDLMRALNALVQGGSMLDWSALDSAISEARNRSEYNYTSASWDAMDNVLTAALVVRGDDDAEQDQIDGAAQDLNAAISALVEAVLGISITPSAGHTFPEAVEGYAAQAPLSITVTNTGNLPTGLLTIVLSGTNAGSFSLNRTSIDDIAVNDEAAFTVVPSDGLTAGEYIATVTVSGTNIPEQQLTVTFNVAEQAFGITLSPQDDHIFRNATQGYAENDLTPHTITVTNTGNRPTGTLNVMLTGENAAAFSLSKTSIPGIYAGESAEFTVVPNLDLGAGTHTATVSVSGAYVTERNFTVGFTVTPRAAVGRSNLVAAIENAESRLQSNYTNVSWAAMQQALSAALTVNNNANATQAEVDEATESLRTALRNLDRIISLNFVALDGAIRSAQNRVQANYTPASWSAMQSALSQAVSVRDRSSTTQSQIDSAAEALRAATRNLVRLQQQPTNRNALIQLIENAEERLSADYTSASWLQMQLALSSAIAARDIETATQLQIDTAANNLRDAINNLVTVTGTPTVPAPGVNVAIDATDNLPITIGGNYAAVGADIAKIIVTNALAAGERTIVLGLPENTGSVKLFGDTVREIINAGTDLLIRRSGVSVTFSANALADAIPANADMVQVSISAIAPGTYMDILTDVQASGHDAEKIILIAEIALAVDGEEITDFNNMITLSFDVPGVAADDKPVGFLHDGGLSFFGGTLMDDAFLFRTNRLSVYGIMAGVPLTDLRLEIGNTVLTVNGNPVYFDAAPFIYFDRTLVPIRAVAEGLGAYVTWHGHTRTVHIKYEGKEIILVIGELIPGLDVPAIIAYDRTFVPIRFIAEAFGSNVLWDSGTRAVYVFKA